MIFDAIREQPLETVFKAECPYLFNGVKDNYYFGPMNYYFKENNVFISYLDESIRFDISEITALQNDFSNQLKNIREVDNDNTNLNDSHVNIKGAQEIDNGMLIDNFEIITQERHEDNNTGACGYVAASMVLNYWNKTMYKGTVKDDYYEKDGQLYNGIKVDRRLEYKLMSYNNNEGESYPWSISDALNKYCDEFQICGAADWCVLSFPIKDTINKGEPIILFGALPDLKSGGLIPIAHAVVCYGYRNINFQTYYYVNYGWEEKYNEVLINPGLLVGGATSFSLNPDFYKKSYDISPSEYGFSSSYCSAEENKTINKYRFSCQTSRYRCGFIENECINLSARKQGYNCAWLDYKFESVVESIELDISFWSDDERFNAPNKAFAAIQYKKLYSDEWVTAVDLLNDISLSTDRKNQDHLWINFEERTKEFRFVAQFYQVVGLNDRNKGRISIGNMTIVGFFN